jgi:hypothetical protein
MTRYEGTSQMTVGTTRRESLPLKRAQCLRAWELKERGDRLSNWPCLTEITAGREWTSGDGDRGSYMDVFSRNLL